MDVRNILITTLNKIIGVWVNLYFYFLEALFETLQVGRVKLIKLVMDIIHYIGDEYILEPGFHRTKLLKLGFPKIFEWWGLFLWALIEGFLFPFC